uniref:Putative metal-binding protein n=1 Tax=Eubacterium cellulosolvens (strain ATCC 43171 / JCM 9499 / 6) TaxID=633697 RepID=I5ATD6_EUBC6
MAEDIRILNGNAAGRRILPDEEMTFRLLHMRPGDPGYEANSKMFRENYTQIGRRMIPKAVAAFGELSGGRKVLCLVMTLGSVISDYIGGRFDAQEYEEGLLFGSMADSALFSFEEQLLPQIRRIVNEKGYGICSRMEIPDEISAEDVCRALELTEAERILGVTATKEGMLHPVKSMCMVYGLTEDVNAFLAGHDCRVCTAEDCGMRKAAAGAEKADPGECVAPEKAADEDGMRDMRRMTIPAGVGVLEYMQTQGVNLSAPCGGRGVCGKCGVQVVKGELPVQRADSICYAKEQLQNGFRLACQAKTESEIEILYRSQEEEFVVQTDTGNELQYAIRVKRGDDSGIPEEESGKTAERMVFSKGKENAGFGIAIDLGTTTLAASLVDLESGRVLGTAAGVNHQRTYGADVISRIHAAEEGRGEELKALIRRDLKELIRELLQSLSAENDGSTQSPGKGETTTKEVPKDPNVRDGNASRIRRIVIAGNTTMEHLLLGYPAGGLGRWPFRPVSLGGERLTAEAVLGTKRGDLPGLSEDVPVDILPGYSTYIGADIAAGMMTAGLSDPKEERLLFVDLGTNGEMAVSDGSCILAASTAAGPALEGGNLSCGCGSVPGAVCRVSRNPEQSGLSLRTETIGGREPVGLCGTGAIEALAVLLDAGIMDMYGTLRKPYFSNGVCLGKRKDGKEIVLTQGDIREIQKAKSAIRAGIEILLKRAGLTMEAIDRVILAGGFGFYLDPARAARIGLLPEAAVKKTTAAGNTSLAGAVCVLTEESAMGKIRRILEKTEEIILGNDEEFRDAYIGYMNFEGEGQDDKE